jgi:SAM-dependent methyltransferase
MNELITAREALAEEWRSASPSDEASIDAFYRDTPNYPADLNAWHETEERRNSTAMAVAAAQVTGAKRVLDVGAGEGHDLKALLAALPDITVGAVEPNHLMREHLAEAGIQAWPQLSLVPSNLRELDMILCLDVLEHVPDPEAMLLQIIDRLKMNGIFVEATATHDVAMPLHLPHLRGWSPARVLDRHGFVCREAGTCRVWQRVREKRADQETMILCAWRDVNASTMLCVNELIRKNWRLNVHQNDALISRVRSLAVSKWLRESDGDVFLMIDSDIVFTPDDAQRVVDLAREKKSIACAAYPVRGGSHLACRQDAVQPNVTFGPGEPPMKIAYAGTGFVAMHRDVCEAVAATMPLTHANEEWGFWPMFMPMIATSPFDDSVEEYLSEDWAFCHRARDLGFATWLDPSVIIAHLGNAQYDVYGMKGMIEAPPTDVTEGANG